MKYGVHRPSAVASTPSPGSKDANPENAGRSIFVPVIVYFIVGGIDRSPRVNPPDEYGGSVMTASTLASGIDRSTASASP